MQKEIETIIKYDNNKMRLQLSTYTIVWASAFFNIKYLNRSGVSMQFKIATKMFTLPSLTPLSSSSGGLQCGLHATQVHPFQLFVICLNLLPVCVLSRASRTQFIKGSNV